MANTDVITLRISSQQKALIDQAAKAVGQNRTAFILENILRCAEDVLLDRSAFRLTARQWQEFNQLLDAPPRPKDALLKLFNAQIPWENDN